MWNLPTLIGILLFGIPLEDLLFAFAFGLCWAGVYEHLVCGGFPQNSISTAINSYQYIRANPYVLARIYSLLLVT